MFVVCCELVLLAVVADDVTSLIAFFLMIFLLVFLLSVQLSVPLEEEAVAPAEEAEAAVDDDGVWDADEVEDFGLMFVVLLLRLKGLLGDMAAGGLL